MQELIPQAWFVDLPQWVLLGWVVGSVAVLIKGADWLVEGASGLAYRAGVPKIVVGATVVALGTTSPECAVSVLAAVGGEPGLALGNAVGSIIADTALIFGLGCLITVLPADRFVLNRQGWVQLATGGLIAGLCYMSYAVHGRGAALGRSVGLLLLGLLVVYLVVSVLWSRRHPFGEPFQPMEADQPVEGVIPIERHMTTSPKAGVLAGWIVMGLVFVVVASRVLINSVSVLAERWGVPQVVVASTLVAVGTSLPEMVVGVASILKGHKELLVGNVIGADVLNGLFVIGASATAAKLPIADNGQLIFLYLHLPVMLVVLVLFRLFIHASVRREHFRRWYGLPLLAIYVGYVVAQYSVARSVT